MLLLILGLAFNFGTVWPYLLIFILICFLPAIHAPSAICPIIVPVPYILLNLKGNFKHSLRIALAFILPFLIIFPWILDMLLPTAKSLSISRPPTLYVQLPLGLLALLLMLVTFFTFHQGFLSFRHGRAAITLT